MVDCHQCMRLALEGMHRICAKLLVLEAVLVVTYMLDYKLFLKFMIISDECDFC